MIVTFSEPVTWVASVMNWWKTEASMPGGRTRGFAVAIVVVKGWIEGRDGE